MAAEGSGSSHQGAMHQWSGGNNCLEGSSTGGGVACHTGRGAGCWGREGARRLPLGRRLVGVLGSSWATGSVTAGVRGDLGAVHPLLGSLRIGSGTGASRQARQGEAAVAGATGWCGEPPGTLIGAGALPEAPRWLLPFGSGRGILASIIGVSVAFGAGTRGEGVAWARGRQFGCAGPAEPAGDKGGSWAFSPTALGRLLPSPRQRRGGGPQQGREAQVGDLVGACSAGGEPTVMINLGGILTTESLQATQDVSGVDEVFLEICTPALGSM